MYWSICSLTKTKCYAVSDCSVKGSKDAWLERNDIAYKTTWDLWVNIVALAAITAGLLFIAYIQLRRIKKLK